MAFSHLLLVWIVMVSAVSSENATLDSREGDLGPLSCVRLFHSHTRRFMEKTYRHLFVLDYMVDNGSLLPKKRSSQVQSASAAAAYGRDTKPWLCSTIYNWVDLGNDYYPRFLKTASCPLTSCWYGIYWCKPQLYTIKVLHRKSGNLKATSSQSDMLCKSDEKLEEGGGGSSSQTFWEFKDMVISVHCDCM